jgi:hypothetical protein
MFTSMLAMFIECNWLYYKSYEDFEGYIDHFLML